MTVLSVVKLPEVMCESCGIMIKKYNAELDRIPCPSCGKRVDLK